MPPAGRPSAVILGQRPRRQDRDPEFEQKLKRFMSQSQERLVDLKRHREGRR